MIQPALTTLSFAQYLLYHDGADFRYERVRGYLVPMTPAPWPHSKIAKFLERIFDLDINRCGYAFYSFTLSGRKRARREALRLLPECIQPQLKYERSNLHGHYPQGSSSLANHELGFRLCRPSLLPNPRDCSNRWRRWRARACRSILRSVSSTISPVRTSKTSSKVTTPETPPYSSTTTARCSWAL